MEPLSWSIIFLAYLVQDQMLNMSHSKTNQKTLHVV